MCPLHEVTWQMVEEYFLSVCIDLLLPASGNPFLSIFFPVLPGICQEEPLSCLCSWLPSLSSTLAVAHRAVEVRWPSFCHFSMSTANTLGLPVHISSFVAFCLMASPSLLCPVLSQSIETFEKQFFLGFICLLIAVPLCPISAQCRWACLSDTMLRTIALWLVLCFWARLCGLTPPHPPISFEMLSSNV